MKKLILLLAILVLATPAFASVGIKTNGGATLGTATDLSLPCDSSSTITSDGSTYNAGCNTNFVMTGISNGGATSMASTTLVVPTSYSYVRRSLDNDASFQSGTLANGVPGQSLTFMATGAAQSGTVSFTITPATSTGFTSIKFTAAKDFANFLYINNTYGWVLINYGGSVTVTQSAT